MPPAKRWLLRLAVLLLIFFIPFSRHPDTADAVRADAYTATRNTTKLIVDARDTQTLSALPRQGGMLLADYGAFSLWRVSPANARSLQTRTSVIYQDDFDTIMLRGNSFDTGTGSPAVSAELRQQRIAGPQFWMVQFIGPIKAEWLDTLRDLGLRPVSYMPHHAYVVWGTDAELRQLEQLVPTSTTIQWAGAYHPAYRLDPSLQQTVQQSRPAELLDVTIQLYRTPRLRQSLAQLQQISDAVYMQPLSVGDFVAVALSLPADQPAVLAHWDDVFNVEPWETPELFDERQGQIVAGNLEGTQPAGPGYLDWLAEHDFPTTPTSYPLVAIVDSGIDVGSAENPQHPDLRELGDAARASRLGAIINCTLDSDGTDFEGHGTLNAGIIGGYNSQTEAPYADAAGYRHGLGISPYGRMTGTKIFDSSGWFDIDGCSDSFTAMLEKTYAAGAVITSNSWGSRASSRYTFLGQFYDAATRDGSNRVAGAQPMLHIFSAGNSGPATFSLGSPATAKNVISVGATEHVRDDGVIDGCRVAAADSADDIIFFSSRGPTRDKRFKPDLVAPGTHIQGPASQSPNFTGYGVCGAQGNADDDLDGRYYPAGQTLYTWSSGTSHSAPAVAGAASLLHEYYERVWNPGKTPSPAMVKALLLNQPRYLTGVDANDLLPSFNQGWGGLNLGAILDEPSLYLVDQDVLFGATGETFQLDGTIQDTARPVAISLVWSDAPGTTTGATLVNDLNLEVTVGETVYRGNVFTGDVSRDGGGFDYRNNVERVYLPAGTGGPISVRVSAANIAGDGVPGNATMLDQDFALVATNVAEVFSVAATDTTWSEVTGNGDTIIDPGETIAVQVTLMNRGSRALTDITGEMTAVDSIATVTGTTSDYPDLSTPGATATNNTGYLLKIGPWHSCGKPLTLAQTITTGDGWQGTTQVSLPTGIMAPAQNYAYTGPSQDIPDNDYIDELRSSMSISDTGTIADVNVHLEITHPWVGDVGVILESPEGTFIDLVDRPGDGAERGANFRGTIFDDEGADGSITAATAPFTGSFIPLDALSRFDGESLEGEWTLYVYDEGLDDIGTLDSWSLDIQTTRRVCTVDSRPIYLPLVSQAQ